MEKKEKELQDKREDRSIQINENSPEILRDPIYTPAFLREQIGRLMKVEFLIGTNLLVDRIGILEDVGASYILLRSFESDSLVFCDIYAIKFITISTTGLYGTMSGMNQLNALAANPMNTANMNPNTQTSQMNTMNNRYQYY